MSHRRTLQTMLWLLMLSVVTVLALAGCDGAEIMAPDPTAARVEAAPTQAGVAAAVATALPPSPTLPSPTATQRAASEPASSPTATTAPASATAAPVPADTPMPGPTAVSAGPPVRLVISGLNMDAPVIPMGWQVVDTAKGPVSQWLIPEDEAGHHINSAALGERGNLVLSGHNNIHGRIFEAISRAWDDDTRVKVDQVTDRSDVLNGQLLELYGAQGERFDYRIEEFYRLRDTGVSQAQRVENARFVQPTEDDRVTIVTCWPPWNNTHRLVLIARPVSQP